MNTLDLKRPDEQGAALAGAKPQRRLHLLGVCAAVLLALGVPVAAAGSASAGGGVNISGWCQQYYSSGYFHGVVVANNVYGWRCQYGSDVGTRLNVDMNAACAYSYPGHPGSARYSNYSNPYSWYCL